MCLCFSFYCEWKLDTSIRTTNSSTNSLYLLSDWLTLRCILDTYSLPDDVVPISCGCYDENLSTSSTIPRLRILGCAWYHLLVDSAYQRMATQPRYFTGTITHLHVGLIRNVACRKFDRRRFGNVAQRWRHSLSVPAHLQVEAVGRWSDERQQTVGQRPDWNIGLR